MIPDLGQLEGPCVLHEDFVSHMHQDFHASVVYMDCILIGTYMAKGLHPAYSSVQFVMTVTHICPYGTSRSFMCRFHFANTANVGGRLKPLLHVCCGQDQHVDP